MKESKEEYDGIIADEYIDWHIKKLIWKIKNEH